MPVGRPRTPSGIRRLTGSHPERINKREPRFTALQEVAVPNEVGIDPFALAKWNELLPELVANRLLNRANITSFAALCMAYANWMNAEKDVREHRRWLKEPIIDKVTGQIVGVRMKYNPAIREGRNARIEFLRHASEFGLTPVTAPKVNAIPPKEAESGFAEFYGSEKRDNAEVN